MTSDFKTLYQKLCSNYRVEKQSDILESVTPDGHLDLSQKTLSPSTSAVLGKIIETTKQITKVSLENCLLEEESLKLLLLGLTNSSSVVNLNLKGNAINGSSALSIAELLKANTSIRSLSLEWNNLGLCVSSFSGICEALIHNRSLLKLDLRSNQLNADAASAISELISKNSFLSTLDLRFNNLGDEGGRVILEGIRYNRTLSCLLINGNNISEHTISNIASHLSNNVKMFAARDEYVTLTDALKQKLKIQEQQASLHIENLEKSLITVNESMASVVRESRAKIEKMEDELTSKSKELRALAIQCEAQSKSLEDRDKAIETLKKESKAMEDEIRSGRENRSQLLREIDEMRDVQAKVEASREENFVLKERLIALEAEIKVTKTEAEVELEAEKIKHKEALRKQEKVLAAQISKLKKEIEEKEGDLKKSKKLWESLKDELETEARILKTNLSTDKEKHQAQISSLKRQLKAENKKEMRILEDELKEVERSREEVEAKLRQQMSTYASFSATNARLESQIHALNTEVVSLQAELAGNEANIRAAEQRVRNEVKKQMEEFQNLKEEKAKFESDFERDKRKREQTVKDLGATLDQKDEEIRRLKISLMEKEQEVFRIKEDESKRMGMLQSAFMKYLCPSGSHVQA